MKFKYDLHVHTKELSACARQTILEKVTLENAKRRYIYE
mgnify:CR=1 FL=1